MVEEGKIWVGCTDLNEHVCLNPQMANRHGLIAGATGTGKTVTLKVLAESFSEMGVPVFLADVKGDVSGMANPGTDSENMQKRIEKFGLANVGFSYQGCPVTLWDIYGIKGIPLRTTVSEMGPLLLSRILGLNDLQSDLMTIAFKIADDNNLLLVDTKDLKAILNYMGDNNKEFAADYGNISKTSIAAIVRAVVSLEVAGGENFFGEPGVNIHDFLCTDSNGKGIINILDSTSLVNNKELYSTFLLWLLSELFETLPEVGDLDKPKLVFIFDEAHLLFDGASKALTDKIEQVVKLIRSKGVGVYFCTQNPKDISDGVLAQLGNKIQHGLRAYTPAEQKNVKAAAQSYRENEAFDTYETILALGTGEAIVSFLDEKGIPDIVRKVNILPPKCLMAAIDEARRDNLIKSSLLYSKYSEAVDPDSAYEFLQRKGMEDAENEAKEKEEALAKKEADKAAKAKEKNEAKEKDATKKAATKAAKSVGNTVSGTVGREVGKQIGSNFGSFGKTLGGNVGASLARGIFSTIFKK